MNMIMNKKDVICIFLLEAINTVTYAVLKITIE